MVKLSRTSLGFLAALAGAEFLVAGLDVAGGAAALTSLARADFFTATLTATFGADVLTAGAGGAALAGADALAATAWDGTAAALRAAGFLMTALGTAVEVTAGATTEAVTGTLTLAGAMDMRGSFLKTVFRRRFDDRRLQRPEAVGCVTNKNGS
jgi:hypothetical protein